VTPERRKKLLYIGGALLLVAVALLAFSHGVIRQEPHDADTATTAKSSDPGVPNSSSIATPQAGEATATPGSAGTGTSSAGSGGSGGGLTAAEAAALQAELSAIEKSLDSMGLPSDSDFKDIESGLN